MSKRSGSKGIPLGIPAAGRGTLRLSGQRAHSGLDVGVVSRMEVKTYEK